MLKNTGNVPLVIQSLDASTMSIEPLATETLDPGEETKALVVGTGDQYGLLINPMGVTFPPEKYNLVQGAFGGALVICFRI